MLINFRNALMAGKRLTYDAEVEFLESTGTQYIDTLVNADSNLSVEITMANAGTPWTNVNPIGAILATPRCRHHLNFEGVVGNGINYYLGNGDFCNVLYRYRPSDGEVFTFKVDAISKTFTLGSFIGTFPNDTFDTGLSYWLFGRNGTTPPYLGSLRICSAKLWNGSILVRDFIPVRKGTVGYLYDRVSGKLFGNAGSGDFVLGPDVVPVEYIESHGTEYINPQVSVASGDSFALDITGAFTGTSSALQLHGVNGGAYFGVQTNGNFTAGGLDTNVANDFAAHTFAFSATIGNSQVVSLGIDGNTYTRTRNNNAGYIGLFTVLGPDPSYPYAYYSKFRMKDASISVNSANVRTMKAIRVGSGSTWEGAMMDTLTRRIYRNAGTGAFGYGNDLKYQIPA